MKSKIGYRQLPYLIATLYIAAPPTLSVFFGVLGIAAPSYLLVSLISLFPVIYVGSVSGKLYAYRLNYLSVALLLFLLFSFYNFFLTVDFKTSQDKIMYLSYTIFVPLSMISILFMASRHVYPNSILLANKICFDVFKYSIAPFLIIFLIFKTADEYGQFVISGLDNPIWISRHLGAALLVYFSYNLTIKKKLTIFNVLVCLLILYCMILVGSRTPLIACFLASILFIVKGKGLPKSILLLWFFSIGILSFAVFYFFSNSYLFETNFWSLYNRLDMLKFSGGIPVSFSGYGLASFGRLFLGEDVYYYPHNIVAELYIEYGLIGITIILLVISAVGKTYNKSIIGALSLYYLINAMSSADLVGNGSLFLAAFVAYNLHCFSKRGRTLQSTGTRHG